MEKKYKNSLVIQYFSDTHLEMLEEFDIVIPIKGDILILAGDIGQIRQPLTREFFTRMCKQFKDVIYVMGNHEYYQTGLKSDVWTMDQIDKETEKFCGSIPNMHLLNKKTWVHPNGLVTFHGCILWSKVAEEAEDIVEISVNDYKFMYKSDPSIEEKSSSLSLVTVKDTNALYEDHFQWLANSIEKSKTPINIVITHHLPSDLLTPKQHIGSPLSSAFSNNLDSFIISHPKITAWINGHSHGIEQITIGNTKCYMYCIGYYFEAFKKIYDSTFEIIY